ncbi:porin family protein [Shivajiella indica]|uniref:Porin family protein n=1 Tax=Shivajiella indica TaxID=872115 RepID=A0ABW5B2K7_9BACT
MKYLLTSVFSFFLIFTLHAQEFSIGPKIGISQGNISVNGEGFESGDEKFGYHLGAFVRMGGHSIFLQPEFLFSQTGGTIIQTNDALDTFSYDASFNRIDIPVMFGFKILRIFRLQAGPIASILLDYTIEDALKNAVDVDYSSSTLGYQTGIGFDIGNIILDFKYESSLSKISKSVVGFETDQRQNQLILSAGIRLF